jgi:hypothetical protein
VRKEKKVFWADRYNKILLYSVDNFFFECGKLLLAYFIEIPYIKEMAFGSKALSRPAPRGAGVDN